MSVSASWFALSVDWSDSEMFDDSTFGVRLAWVELLAHVKAQGRAGKARLRVKSFAMQRRLTEAVVEDMLARAVSAGAVIRHGDEVTVCNWRVYQDPSQRSYKSKEPNELTENDRHFTKTSESALPATCHLPPSPSPITTPAKQQAGAFAELAPADLGDASKVEAWRVKQSKKRKPVIPNNENARIMVHAAAVKALSAEANAAEPVGLFGWLVSDASRWSNIPERDVDEARRRIADLTRGPPVTCTTIPNFQAPDTEGIDE
jgi:hypothetical protein